MTIAAIVTLGYSGGVKYISTLGYLPEASPSFAVVDTFLPREKKKRDWDKYREEKGEIRRQLTKLYHGIRDGFEVEPDEKAAILGAVTSTQEIDYDAFVRDRKRRDLLISAYERLIALHQIRLQEQDDDEAILLLM